VTFRVKCCAAGASIVEEGTGKNDKDSENRNEDNGQGIKLIYFSYFISSVFQLFLHRWLCLFASLSIGPIIHLSAGLTVYLSI